MNDRPLLDPALASRIARLEAQIHQRPGVRLIDKVTTGPEIKVDLRSTHADTEAHAVKLVPIDLPAPMLLRRVSFLAGATNKEVVVSLAIYRLAEPTRIDDQLDPVPTLRRSAVIRVAYLGQSRFGPQSIRRQAVTLSRALFLDPSAGPFYLAWQTSDSDTQLGVLPTNIAGVSPSAAGDVDLTPSPASVKGAVRWHVGSVYLRAGKADFDMMLGATPGDTGSLELRRMTNAVVLLTFTKTGAVAVVTAAAISVVNAGWYDLYLFASGVSAVAYARGGHVRYIPTDQTANLPEQVFATSYNAQPAGTYAGDFPAEVQLTGAAVWVPLFVLRSSLGMRQTGDFGYD